MPLAASRALSRGRRRAARGPASWDDAHGTDRDSAGQQR